MPSLQPAAKPSQQKAAATPPSPPLDEDVGVAEGAAASSSAAAESSGDKRKRGDFKTLKQIMKEYEKQYRASKPQKNEKATKTFEARVRQHAVDQM
eukprot:2016814-Prymnesium_polylepis.1